MRATPDTTASPLVHTVIATNPSAENNARDVPMNRPATPKCAPEETALFVPVRGAMSPIGASASPPTKQPAMIDAIEAQKLSPNRIGNDPKMITLYVRSDPNRTEKMRIGRNVRSLMGMVSTPWFSTVNASALEATPVRSSSM
jgi:hypothetical protein